LLTVARDATDHHETTSVEHPADVEMHRRQSVASTDRRSGFATIDDALVTPARVNRARSRQADTPLPRAATRRTAEAIREVNG
jgi:hypothetical protein